MAREFTWSFGGDSNAEQAIDEWKKQPRYMLQLGRVTKSQVHVSQGQIRRMPGECRRSFRAGFKLSEGQWKMVYFVEGD